MNIIQIGCHTGEDHVHDFIKKNNCNKIILIDANPYALDICKQKYIDIQKNIIFLNYAIVPRYVNDNKHITFYIPEQDKTSAHCSVSLDFIKKHNHEKWIEKTVPCITLNDLFKQINISLIDRLYIDAEGLDSEIVLSLDLESIKIDYIFFEHMHSDGAFSHGENLRSVISKLQKNGYSLKDNDMYNVGFIKL